MSEDKACHGCGRPIAECAEKPCPPSRMASVKDAERRGMETR